MGREADRTRVCRMRRAALLILALCGPGARAESPAAAEQEPPPSPTLRMIEEAHAAVSQQVESTSESLDEFFGGERVYYESTGSYARLRSGVEIDQNGGLGFSGDLRVKLSLPETENRLKFLLESNPEQPIDETTDQVENNPLTVAQQSTYAAALQTKLRHDEKWDISTDAGIKLRWPPDPFVRLRARRSFVLERWVARATQSLFWFNSQGTGTRTRLDFERPYGRDYFFRSTSEAVWHNDGDNFDLRQTLSLYQDLSPRRRAIYQLSALGESRPVLHSTSYLLDVRLRQQVHKDWLFLELNPRVEFARENGFQPAYTLILLADVIFGEAYL